MKFTLEVDCDNAAFDDGNHGAEVARILRQVAEHVEHTASGVRFDVPLFDINGNQVGSAALTN